MGVSIMECHNCVTFDTDIMDQADAFAGIFSRLYIKMLGIFFNNLDFFVSRVQKCQKIGPQEKFQKIPNL